MIDAIFFAFSIFYNFLNHKEWKGSLITWIAFYWLWLRVPLLQENIWQFLPGNPRKVAVIDEVVVRRGFTVVIE